MNPIEFARNLFLLRRENKMTVEELADALQVTPERICEWECAKTSPSLEQMNRLAKIYGIPLSDVIRTPKPMDEVPVEEFPDVIAESEPVEEVPEAEEPAPCPSAPKKKKAAAWEIIIILLLLLIIAAATLFLIKPEWFPLKQFFASAAALNPFLLR